MNLSKAISFYWNARTINRIHSPYVFKLVKQLFDFSKTYYDDYALDELRKKLLTDKTKITYKDLGAGAGNARSAKVERTVAKLAKTSSSSKLKCRLLRNAVLFFRPQSILEIGTNLGLSTAYMSSAAKSVHFTSVEGAESLVGLAKQNLDAVGLTSVNLLHMDFDSFFDRQQFDTEGYELVYLDGNHKYESTIKYFDALWSRPSTKVIIVDDINWSDGMTKAWKEIITREGAHYIDLFKLGIVFKNEALQYPVRMSCVPRLLKPWQLGFFG